MDRAISIRPSRVTGVADAVDAVWVYPDRLELRTARERLVFPFMAFARGREIGTGRVPVGELHFSGSEYAASHFVFYTTPRVAIYMPAETWTAYPHSVFWRVQELLRDLGFRLYEGGPPKVAPIVLDPRPLRTVVYVLAILGFALAYGLSGLLPGSVGEALRGFLLSNPRNPSIGLAFILPAVAVPAALALRHGRTARAVAAVVAASYALASASELALRHAIRSWAALERPPLDMPFWTAHRLGTSLIVVAVAALIGWSWRRSLLEPIPRPRDPKTGGGTGGGPGARG
jgi:hypothetical protein